ncbi:glycoside hydrolase family 79 protein [Neofusicoccum parvum]|uniref:Glycoside hydrolase family 79 protein n=1 Tax=Neofusicoccum parvum TaxID=310453 RepID=A0ACB5RZL7_9PEZI|nr:glycoside hydrolase family 79 protein [Neofusicoccum parvum]
MRLTTTTPTLLATAALAQTITLSAPPTLNSTARPINGAFQSFSIEFAYMADYFGNLTAPNTLSHALLSHLSALAGATAPPALRAGGSTANRAAYNASQPVAVVNTFGGNPDQPSAVSVGPAWYEAFLTAPRGTRVVYDVNYRDNSTEGVERTVEEVGRVWERLGEVLEAVELGNEVEGWAGRGRGVEWGPEAYVEDYLNYTRLVDERVFGEGVEPIFQGGVLQGSGGRWINEPWNSVVLLEEGLNRDGQIKSMSQHDYHGSNCESGLSQGIIPELRKNLLNHTNVIDRVWPHQQMSPVVVSQGIEAIGGNGNAKQVRSIVEAETFVAYALYGETRLDSLIVVNMEPFNATTSGSRPYVTVQVPSAPGKGVGSGTRKSVMKDGSLSGDEMVEIVQPGEQIKLQNSEAILIKI